MTEKLLSVERRDIHVTHSEKVPKDSGKTNPSIANPITDIEIDCDEYPRIVVEEEDVLYVRKKPDRA